MTVQFRIRAIGFCLLALFAVPGFAAAQAAVAPAKPVRELYVKQEQMIPMRDGVRLFTSIYVPKDASRKYPILLVRTPYSVGPYGKDQYRSTLGPSNRFDASGYIFVYQDVRGCFLSEGQFEDMRPHIDLNLKTGPGDIDESSDTYDTIDWLVKNIPNNNGRVGQWGISYPGFYTAAGMIDAHPALQAVSPQAPIADWFFDDFHHHGAFFLPHGFNFISQFSQPRPEPTTKSAKRFEHGTPDGYQFFLDLGPLKNANERYFRERLVLWNRMVDHPNYDAFWQARNLLPHLRKVPPAVLTVGGWFDAEDLYGPLKIYRQVKKDNPGIFNALVMGPWQHGGWNRTPGDRLGDIHFGAPTASFFQQHIEFPFFEHYLKSQGDLRLPEAYVFETGVNRWRQFDHWPPKNLQKKTLYFQGKGRLTFDPPADEADVYDDYISDPAKPVPFSERIGIGMSVEYMTDDQRFAGRRPDVLVYQTDVLADDVTLAGPIQAELLVATSGTDADWVVKLIDVYPNDAKDYPNMRLGEHLGGYQMMVRSEVIRGRFRNSYDRPEPFVSDEPTRVPLELLDVLHTFKKGHRIMVQVQSTWFPLVDRNPQKYVANIYRADAADFIKATQRVYRSRNHPTRLEVGVLPTQE
jgi:putative CocE/NonD family hydrolase